MASKREKGVSQVVLPKERKIMVFTKGTTFVKAWRQDRCKLSMCQGLEPMKRSYQLQMRAEKCIHPSIHPSSQEIFAECLFCARAENVTSFLPTWSPHFGLDRGQVWKDLES